MAVKGTRELPTYMRTAGPTWGRDCRPCRLLGVASVLLVALAANPAVATTPASRTFVPPFSTALTLTHNWTNLSRPSGTILLVSPAANAITGSAVLEIGLQADKMAKESLTALAGFSFPFQILRNGTHGVVVNWSLSWNATAMSFSCNAKGNCAAAGGEGRLYLEVIDLTNNTTYKLGSTGYRIFCGPFSSFSPGSGRTFASGHRNLTIGLNAYLVRGHSYSVKSFAWAEVWASNPPASHNVKSAVKFNMAAGGNGADMNWISIR